MSRFGLLVFSVLLFSPGYLYLTYVAFCDQFQTGVDSMGNPIGPGFCSENIDPIFGHLLDPECSGGWLFLSWVNPLFMRGIYAYIPAPSNRSPLEAFADLKVAGGDLLEGPGIIYRYL